MISCIIDRMELRFKFPVLSLCVCLGSFYGVISSPKSATASSESLSSSTELTDSPSMTFSCSGRNGFYTDPMHNCTHYLLCSPDGSRVKFQCATGKSFDFKSQSCLEKSKVSCSTNEAGTSSRIATKLPFVKNLRSSPESTSPSHGASSGWLKNGFAQSPSPSNTSENMVTAASDNKEYFTKVSPRIGGIFSKKIPTKTVLASSASNNVFVTEKPLDATFDCSGRTGYFPDVSSHCNFYVYCDTTGKALRFQCPLDLAFDMQDLACVFPHKTKCGSEDVGVTEGLAPRQLLNSAGGYGGSGQGNIGQVTQGSQLNGGTSNQGGQNQFSNNGQSSTFQNNQQNTATSFQQQIVPQQGFQQQQQQQFPQQSGPSSFGQGQQSGLNQNLQQTTQYGGSSQQSIGGASYLPTASSAGSSGYGDQNQGAVNFPTSTINNNQQQFSTNQNSAGFASSNGFSNVPQQNFQNSQQGSNLLQSNPINQAGQQSQQLQGQKINQAQFPQVSQQINQAQFPQSNQQQQISQQSFPTLPGGAGGYGSPSLQPSLPVIRQPIQQPQILQPSFPQQPSSPQPSGGYGGTFSPPSYSLQPTVQPTLQSFPTQFQSPQPSLNSGYGTSSYASPLPSQPISQPTQSPRPSYSPSPTPQGSISYQSPTGGYGNTGISQSPQPSFPVQTPSPIISIPFTIPQTSYAIQGPSGGYGSPAPFPQITQPAPIVQIQQPAPTPNYPQPSQQPQPVIQSPTYSQPQISQPVYTQPTPPPQQPVIQTPSYSQPQQPVFTQPYPSPQPIIQTPSYSQPQPQQPVYVQPAPSPQPTFAPQPQIVQAPAQQPQVPYAIQGPSTSSGYGPPSQNQNFNNQVIQQVSSNSFSGTQQVVPQQQQQFGQNVQQQLNQNSQQQFGQNTQPQFPQTQTIQQQLSQAGQQFPQTQQQGGGNSFGGGGYGSGGSFGTGGSFSAGGAFASDQIPGSDLTMMTPAVEGVALIKSVETSTDPANQDVLQSFGKKEMTQRLHEIPQVDASCNGRARGFYPLPGCQDYFYCSTFGERLNYTCQPGLLWNTGKGLCEDETLTICTNPTNRNGKSSAMLLTIRVRSDENGSQSVDGLAEDQPGSFDCTGKLGIFPDLRSGCRFFHRCASNGQMETHKCAGILVFNARAGLCVDPSTFTCPANNTAQPVPMTERSLTRKAFDCRKQNGFFADVADGCRSYYFCAQDGKSYKFVCPLNYHYSEVKEACDAPERTPCESHLSVAKNLIPNMSEMVAQASDNIVTRTRFQPPKPIPPKTITNGWVSAPEALTSRTATRQDATWTSFPDDQHFVVSSHLESPRPNKPNFPSTGPVVVQPVPQSPQTNNQQVVNGFIVGSSPNGQLHFDPSFNRQVQSGLFHPPLLSPPLQGVAQTVIKNITPPNDMRALTHRMLPDGQFVSSLRQGEKPSSNSPFTIIPVNAPFTGRSPRPDPRLVIQEQLLAFELARQRNAQFVELQERKLLQDRLNQLKNNGPPFSGQFVHLNTDAQPIRKAPPSSKDLLTRHPFDLQQDVPQRILTPATFPPIDAVSIQPGTECTLGVRGYFPDVSSDCRNYFFCDGRGHRLEHSCPPGMAFNTTLIACDLDMFSTCRKTHSLMSKSMATGLPVVDRGNSCSGRKTGYYANFSHRCAKYFYCSMSGDQIEYNCPMDFFFDEFRGVCVEFGNCMPSFAHIEGAATTTQQLKEMGFAMAGRFPRQFDQVLDPVADIFGPALSLLGRRTEEFSFPCREIGHFADFDSGCNGFWACTDTVSMAKLVKCPMGQLFDPNKKHCAPAFVVQCLPPTEQKKSLGTVGFTCLGKTPTFHADMTEQCRKFHHCTTEGEMLSYTCPFDWLYNEEAGECVSPDNFTCPSQKKSMHHTFDCVGKSGYYADFEHQCQFFHLCILNGTRTTMACPTAMVFDENESKCVYGTLCAPTPASADHLDISFGNNGNAESSFLCPVGATGFFGDPLFSCRTYWQCMDGARLSNRSCPGLLRFNATTKSCEQARHVICADPLVLESLFPGLLHGNIAPRIRPFEFSPFRLPLDSFNKFFDPSVLPVAPPPDFAFSPSRLLCEPGQLEFFAEPKSNCRTFFYCESDGMKKHFACPSNMLFDETVGRCQDETASVCGPRLFFQRRLSNQGGFGFGQEGVLEGVPVGICGGRVGVFADIGSGCHNFFMCHANGTLVNQSCPASLLFNERNMMCDWPINVRCGESVVQSQNLLLGMPVGPRFNPLDPSGNMLFVPGSIPGSLFQVPGFGEATPNDPFSRSLTPFQLSPSEQSSIDFPKYSADGKHLELALGSSNPSRFSPVDAFGRPHPGVLDTGLRLHPQLPVSLQSSGMNVESYSPYGSRAKWLARRLSTTTVAPVTTTGLPTTTGRPGWEEGEYEPEEGVMPAAVTTTALPAVTTTTPIAVVRSMPLMYDPLLGYNNLNHPLNDAIKTKSKVPTSTMDPVKSFGVDCYGKKGYFLSPGTACKSYVFCKPHGAIYSFTCPGEYLYNAEKEICDWPDNVICASTSSRTAPKGSLRRWRRAPVPDDIPNHNSTSNSVSHSNSGFVCPNTTGYFANQEDNCFSFFYCDENQTATRHECQDRNLHFDEVRGVCEWSTRVRCGNGSLVQDSTVNSIINNSQNFSVAPSSPHDCPFTGFFADFSSGCRNFSFCPTTEGPRLVFRCPEGLLYDDSKGKCQTSTAVTCTRYKQSRSYGAKVRLVTRTRLVISNADSPVDCRNQRGLFADPKSHCANFFYCSPQGLKFEYACPNGMAFNNAVKACDDLLNSSCSLIP